MKLLITGAAGFIGYHAVTHYAVKGNRVVGIDNLNDFYDIDLKYARLAMTGIDRYSIQDHQSVQSCEYPNYRFIKADLQDKLFIDKLFAHEHFDVVCHLAAQAGVRHSIGNPYLYMNSNITGFLNILEACRSQPVKHLVYASSSSVYGTTSSIPFSETDQVDRPESLYAATKKSNELMAYTYSSLYKFPTTGLRFFSVYGPWGRPDMAPYLFMKSILKEEPILVFNHGKLSRDFTYIDDIIEGLTLIIDNPSVEITPYRIYNIGAGKPINLLDFIRTIENITGKEAVKKMVDMQSGDVFHTYADTSRLERDVNFKPKTSVFEGISRFYEWFTYYYKI